jgi:hypothetical protein
MSISSMRWRAASALITAMVMLALLACGCAGHKPLSTAANERATSSASPTATPITAAELAWVAAVTKLRQKIDKPFAARNINMTRAKMTQLGATAGTCSRKLHRSGVPGVPLQPVYAIVKKACRTYDRAARCLARAASVSAADGSTYVGTPQARTQRRSLTCGFAAQGNASNRLGDAVAKAQQIKSHAP